MNGFIEKFKQNEARLANDDLAAIAAQLEASGCDANPEQWDQLNEAVAALPEETPEEAAARGVADNGRLVSGDKPGTGSNPIGFPGTDQDQEAPGQRPKTVPGVKPIEKPGK